MTAPLMASQSPLLMPHKAPTLAGPIRLDDWYGAPRILDSLLALCEPPGWDLTPAQRLGRRNATSNAMRLWSLLDDVFAQERAASDLGVASSEPADMQAIRITGPHAAWHWSAWRHGEPQARRLVISVDIEFADACCKFALELQDSPGLLRKLQAQRSMLPETSSPRWIWALDVDPIPMAYPQARAFVAALVFRAGAASVQLGPQS